MTLQKLDQRALDLIGFATSEYLGLSDNILDDWFTAGHRDFVQKVIVINREKLELFCSAATALSDSSGKSFEGASSLTSDIIYTVTRSDGIRDYTCRKVPLRLKGEVDDVNSIHFATKRDPVWYVEQRKVYVKPDPTTIEKASIYHPQFIYIDASTQDQIDDYTGINFPFEGDEIVIAYVVIQARYRELMYVRKESNDELTSIDTAYTNFLAALPTYVSPVQTVLPTLTLESLGSMSTSLPTFVNQVFSISTTQIDDAITKAQTMIDSDTTKFEAEILADNIEVANAIVNAAAQEVNRARTSVQNEANKVQKYVADIQQELQRFNNEVTKFTAELAEDIQKYRNQNDVKTAEYVVKAQAYVAEHSAAVNTETSRVTAELSKAGAFLQEITSRLSKSQDFNQRSQLALADIVVLTTRYEKMIEAFAKS